MSSGDRAVSREGFWIVDFHGAQGSGAGVIVLDTQIVIGADGSGIVYDGTYSADPATGDLICKVRATAKRPGIILTQNGKSLQPGDGFDLAVRLPRELNQATLVRIDTAYGPVAATFTKVRDFP